MGRGGGNKGFLRSFLYLLVADLQVAPKETKCLVCLVGDGVDMGTPFNVVMDVFCG